MISSLSLKWENSQWEGLAEPSIRTLPPYKTAARVDSDAIPTHRIFFSALAQGLQSNASQTKGTEVATTDIWNAALEAALKRLYTYTRARPPSRTLVDPLSAFVENLFEGYPAAVKSAADAAEETKNVEAKAGRSAYVDSGLLTKERVADPGAWGVKVILEALFS